MFRFNAVIYAKPLSAITNRIIDRDNNIQEISSCCSAFRDLCSNVGGFLRIQKIKRAGTSNMASNIGYAIVSIVTDISCF